MPNKIESICYDKNFLKDVIFRIDFSPILKINTELPVEFQEAIKKELPVLEIQNLEEVEAEFRFPGPMSTKTTNIPQYIFSNKETGIRVTLNFESLIIHYRKYDTYENFKKIVELAYDQFQKKYSPIAFKRIGLRFVNEIVFEEGNPFDWNNYIAKPLVEPIENFFDDQKTISRSIGQTIQNKENHILKFTYGIYNKTSFPAPIARKEFILDYDCNTQVLEESNVMPFLKTFHDEIQALFEKSITDELRNYMGVKK